jgi:hypothetical protein
MNRDDLVGHVIELTVEHTGGMCFGNGQLLVGPLWYSGDDRWTDVAYKTL